MLVLSRGPKDKVLFPNLGISVEILRIAGNRVRVGVEAPKDVRVLRHELEDTLSSQLQDAWPEQERELNHRLRNRFYCKFMYYPVDFGPLGCVGCGRCIDACPVNIDILEVVGMVEGMGN